MHAPADAPKPKPSLLRKILRWTVLATAGMFAALFGFLLVRPEALLFFPSSNVAHTPDEIGWTYELLELPTDDGETIVAWYLPGTGQRGAVIYCHGNGGNIGDRMSTLAGLRQLGMAVLIFDYRGYGESTGRPTVEGTRRDVQAAWRELVETRGFSPGEIVLWGRSLGGAVAIDQAARVSEAGTPPAALVVESTFTSTVDIGRELYPWLPVGWFARKIDYPSLELIGKVRAPVLLAHSREDELIPYAHGQRLLDAAQAGAATRVQFIELTGGHNEGFLGEVWYHERVTGFLRGGE